MCPDCQNLVNAIDRYIEKADDDLSGELGEEGYAKAKDSVKAIDELEDGLEKALTDETDYVVGEANQSDTLENFASKWDGIKKADTTAEVITEVTRAELEKYMPDLITAYIQQTDRSLKLNTISKKTTAWIQSWSEELGNIMQLDSHKEIEKILYDGLEAGQGISEFVVKIQDSGIRDEYYRARRTAVTEVLRAHSVSQQEAYMQSPSVSRKMWRHSGGYRIEPRENHVAMDGQIVEKQEPYQLIGSDGIIYHPMYPRDISLPAGESINCHCLSQPIVDEDVLGLSLEKRQAMQSEAIEEMDAEWESELNAQRKLESLIGQ